MLPPRNPTARRPPFREDAAEHADSRTSESSSAPRALESRDGIKARLEADDRRKKARKAEEERAG